MPFLVWLTWFGFYLRTLSPGLGGEDSGEFAATAVSLGISHPPGYPLLALSGKLVSLVPLGSPAFRLNLYSAACAAGALAILFSLVRRAVRDRWGVDARTAAWTALMATAMLGFSQALWRQAVISDKYPLNLILLSAALWSVLAGRRRELTAFLLGLGFAHHMQALYLVPGLGWLAWKSVESTPRRMLVCAIFFTTGLSPKLLYPPVRAVIDPATVLGRSATAGQWFSYVRASQYGRRMGADGIWPGFSSTARVAGGQGMWIEPVAGIAGLALWSAGAGPAGVAVGLTAATGILLTSFLSITGREFYLLPVAWILSFGLGCLLAWSRAGPPLARPRPFRAGPGFRRLASLALAIPLVMLAHNLPLAGSGRNSLEYDYGRDILAGLPARSVLFAGGDDLVYPVMYLQGVEGFRPDITVIPEGFLSFGPSRERLKKSEPGLARALEGDAWLRTEEEWGNAVARAVMERGRRVFWTTASRTELISGFSAEPRDLVIELSLNPFPRHPVAGTAWMRARGWDQEPRGLTERQGHIIALYALYQRRYAGFLCDTGHLRESISRFRRALSSPRLDDRDKVVGEYSQALARLKAGEIRP